MSSADRTVLSVMGPHAGEDSDAIFARKISDITTVGKTFWLCQSPAARPDRTQAFFEDEASVLFLAAAATNGARATESAHKMIEFSPNKSDWKTVPSSLSPITGLAKSTAYAFVLSALEVCVEPAFVDLWRYVDANGSPIRFRLGASTLLARRCDSSLHPLRMKSRMRRVLAVGRLVKPYAVWVR